MKKILLSGITLLTLTFCRAQAPNWLWGETGNGNGFGYCSALAIDTSNHLFIAGRAGSSITLGGLTVNTSSTIPFMGKCDTSGLGIWLEVNTSIGGFDYPWGEIYVDNAGNSYGSGNVSSGSSIYVDKYNKNGNLNWTYTTPDGNGGGYGVATDVWGNVYNTGAYSAQTIFGYDTLTTGGSAWAGYVAKFDSGGNVKWATRFCGTNADDVYDAGKAIRTDRQGNVYVCGTYQDTAVFHSAKGTDSVTSPAAAKSNSGFGSLFIAKYDSSGNILWVTTVNNAGEPFNDWGYWNFMAIDTFNNLYIAGMFEDTATFGTISVISDTTYNFFVAKFNTSAMQWDWVQIAKDTAGNSISGNSEARGLALDKKGNVYVTGDFTAPATFDTTTLTSGNIFVAKYANSTGALQWIQTANITGQAAGTSGIAVDNQNYVYVSGTYSGSTSTLGSISLQNANGGSFFLAKLNSGSPAKTGNPYYPMFGYEHTWYVNFFVPISTPRTSQQEDLPYNIMTTSGDTLMDTTLYYKTKIIGAAFDTTFILSDTTFYFREDTVKQQVFIRTSDSTEKLLYDFSLQKGDSVYLTFDFTYPGSNNFYNRTGWYFVDSVKTVNIYSGARKALFLSNPKDTFDTAYYSHKYIKLTELEWIEQVGSTIMPDYLQHDLSNYLSLGFNGYWDYVYILLCSFDSTFKIYHNTALDSMYLPDTERVYLDNDSCIFEEYGGGINIVNKKTINLTIIPNPANSQVLILVSCEPGSIEGIEITNVLGQVVYKSLVTPKFPERDFKQTIDVSALPDGLYFITAITDAGTVTEKFVVSR